MMMKGQRLVETQKASVGIFTCPDDIVGFGARLLETFLQWYFSKKAVEASSCLEGSQG